MTDMENSGPGLSGLSRRAKTALGVAAASLFLLLCLTTYGREQAEIVRRSADAGLAPTIAGWFVTLCGAGAYVVAILGLAWGVIVYFQERTPDLVLRGVGTAILAVSTALLAGLVGDGERSLWAGAVGTAAAKTILGWGTLGRVFGWLAGIGLFAVSLAFATDWLFRTVRRGDRAASAMPRIPTEPSRGELLDDPADAEPRLFIRSESRASTTAAGLTAQAPAVSPQIVTTHSPRIVHELLEDEYLADVRSSVAPPAPPREEPRAAPVERIARSAPEVEIETALPERPAARPAEPQAEIPEGWTKLRFGGRDLVRAPQGYSGVEFLPESDELATPETDQVRAATAARTVASFVDEVTYHPPQVQDIDLSLDEPEAPPPAPRAQRAPEPPAPLAEAPLAETPIAADQPSGGIGLADPDLLLDDDVLSVSVAPFADLEGPAHDGASAADEIVSAYAAPAPAPAPVAAAAPVALPATQPSEEPRSSTLEDEVLVGNTLFSDDVLLFAEPAAPAPAPVVAERPVAPPPPPRPAVAEEPEVEFAAPARAEVAVEPWDFPPVHAVDLGIDVEPADVAEVPVAEAPIVEEQPAESLDALEAPAAPLLDDEISIADPYEAETTDVSVLAPRSAPVPETPAPPAPAAEVRAEPAAPPSAAVPPSLAPQLALFPPPECDLTKLAALELDPLFHAAADAILVRGRASAVVLQRSLGIGYARALRILDQMTTAGMLGPDAPGGSREICFTREQWAGSRA